MTNERRFYTYAYLREDGTPYYIGKGQGKRAYRKGKHEVNPPKHKSRVIFLKRNLTEGEAFRHEIYMIAVFGRKDLGTGILRNKTDGGDGPSNPSKETREKLRKNWQNMSEESKQKHREKLKRRKYSLNHRQKIGEANRRRKLSQAARDKISAAHRGKKVSEGTRRKMSEFQTGLKWWNNGEINKRCPECPGEGWDLGCLQKPHKKFQPPTNSLRFKCLVTGHVSTPAGLTSWQKARNIDTSLREKVRG